jgi:hypothetical protein
MYVAEDRSEEGEIGLEREEMKWDGMGCDLLSM